MKRYYYNKLSKDELQVLTFRPAINFDAVFPAAEEIISAVKTGGDAALAAYGKKFGEINPGESLRVKPEEFAEAERTVSADLKNAIETAINNIRNFHLRQKPEGYSLQTMEGVNCSRVWKPLSDAGLYIPGGTAPLPSTVMMLTIPAVIAGCKRIALFSPARKGRIDPVILYTAAKCGVTEFYKTGGAHSVAAMAYGTETIKKVNKIFGPGNQYVTAAKMIVSARPGGCVIDMPAGPSELLVIADDSADPDFIAADLLSQAEHGADSQVVFVTDSEKLADAVEISLNKQVEALPRKEFAAGALGQSFTLITPDINTAAEFSDSYAPEHLIINTVNSGEVFTGISNAGSVFLGQYTPESAGDYASGTNHSLPTYGYARAMGGVTVESFMKSITMQEISSSGLHELGKTVITLAEAEGLTAHKRAVEIRLSERAGA